MLFYHLDSNDLSFSSRREWCLWVFFQIQTNWRSEKWKEGIYGALNALSVSVLKSEMLFHHLVSNVLSLTSFEPSVCFLLDLIQPFLFGIPLFRFLIYWHSFYYIYAYVLLALICIQIVADTTKVNWLVYCQMILILSFYIRHW